MKEPWSLPGPARLVADVVADLMDGRQIVIRADQAPPGLSSAVEDALAIRQRALHVIYDEDHLPPRDLLVRAASDGFSSSGTPRPGIYWVGDILPHRADFWTAELSRLAELQRDGNGLDKVQVTLVLPQEGAKPEQLIIVEHFGETLSRMDLDVAVRYEIAADGLETSALLSAALAVEMAAPLLPSFVALDALVQWLSAPGEVLADAAAIITYATACGLWVPDQAEATLALWRAQQSVLLAVIDEERLRLLRRYPDWWRVPYANRTPDGRPGRLVTHADFLEITHLCAQVADSKIPYSNPIRQRLETLREARNALSHLEPLGPLELSAFLYGATVDVAELRLG